MPVREKDGRCCYVYATPNRMLEEISILRQMYGDSKVYREAEIELRKLIMPSGIDTLSESEIPLKK